MCNCENKMFVNVNELVEMFNFSKTTMNKLTKKYPNLYCDEVIFEVVYENIENNRDCYNGLSVLPRNDHSYIQAPFEECSKEKFDSLYATLKNIDLTKVIEQEDNTDLSSEAACAGGACEVNF